MTLTKVLAWNGTALIRAVKSFVTQAPGVACVVRGEGDLMGEDQEFVMAKFTILGQKYDNF
jgi:hypothetical protein